LLQTLQARGERCSHLANKAVGVVLNADPKHGDPNAIASGLEKLGVASTVIGFDPAMIDGVLTWDTLKPSTKQQWIHAGALVAQRL
jgi:hypothetical protein